MRSLRALLVSVLLAGCVPGELDLEGRACPCAEGWTCDPARDVCVRGQLVDAGSIDAGARDAGDQDSGRREDGGRDAAVAPEDAGSDGGSDAGPDSTGCDDVRAGALFCDGFEALDFAGWDYTFANSGTLARSTTRVLRGDGALHATTTGPSGEVAARWNVPGAPTSGELYLRAFVYVPSSVTIVSNVSLMQLGHGEAPWEHVGLSIDAPNDTSMYLTTDGGTAWRPGAAVPRDEWVCLELHVTVSNTDGVVEYWMNGALQGRASSVDSAPGRGYERFVIGLPYTPADQPAAEVFVDEVVFDDAPIGCD